MSREMILRKSTRQTRAQSNARETEEEGSVPETAEQAVNSDMECKMSKSKPRSRITRLKKTVRDKTVDVIQIDKDSDLSEDDSSFLQRDQSYEKDFSMCSQENSADVLWDCTSPDMRKISRSKKKKDKLKYSVGDIVQTLSTTSDIDAEDSEDRSKNGLLGLWMDPESSDNLSRLTSTASLANFSPTSSFPPPKARKEKREVTDTLSSVLKEKLSMRIKKEKPSPPRRITRSTEKRKRGSVLLNTSDTKESPSKICKIETDVLKGCNGTDLSENFSETSWSEDDFYEDDSFIIKATQAPSDLCYKVENSSKKEKKTKTPYKYLNQKNTTNHCNRNSSVTVKETDKNKFSLKQFSQSVSPTLSTTTHKTKDKNNSATAEVKKTKKRSSLGLNSSVSDDILCQIVEKDCILDSQLENDNPHDENVMLEKVITNSICDAGVKITGGTKCPEVKNPGKSLGVPSTCASKTYTFISRSKDIKPSSTSTLSVKQCEKTLIRNGQSVPHQVENVQRGQKNPPDESVDLFQSDEEDLLSEPQVLALLDAVESQIPNANCSFSSSQPNRTPEKSTSSHTKSVTPCKSRNLSGACNGTKGRKCTEEEIQQKKNAAMAKMFSSSQPTNSRTVWSPEKNPYQSISPQKCTPEEIEQKRQTALAKRHSSSQETASSQSKHELSSIFCLSQNKEKISDEVPSKSSPRKCSPEEIKKKRELALAKRQKKCSGNVTAPVLANLEQSDCGEQTIMLPETSVCSALKVDAGNRNTLTEANKSKQIQVIEQKRLQALKRRELKMKASQACKSTS